MVPKSAFAFIIDGQDSEIVVHAKQELSKSVFT